MRRHFSGRDFLRAAVAGYEIGPRVGMCMGPEHIGQGWHSGATVGVFSAAAGAARGLKLDAEQTVHALGIAGTQAAGLMAAQYGAMVKRMHAGRARRRAGSTARCSRKRASPASSTCSRARTAASAPRSRARTDRFELDELTAGLGERWETMGVALKFYSCVGSNHTTLDAHPRHAASATRSGRRSRAHRRARLAGDDGSRRLELRARGPHVGAAQPALLRRHPSASKATASSTSSPKTRSPIAARMALAEKVEVIARSRPSRRAVRVSGTWCASTCI